jgi:hypothetical protein
MVCYFHSYRKRRYSFRIYRVLEQWRWEGSYLYSFRVARYQLFKGVACETAGSEVQTCSEIKGLSAIENNEYECHRNLQVGTY